MRSAIVSNLLKLSSLSSTRNVKSPSNCISYKYQRFSSRTRIKSSHRRYSVNKGVLKNFAKFTGKHLCQSLSAKFLRTSFFTEDLWRTASGECLKPYWKSEKGHVSEIDEKSYLQVFQRFY